MGLRSFVLRGGVGRGNWRLHCRVYTPYRKNRYYFQEYKHTSLIFLVGKFCELRPNGVLGSWHRGSAGGIMLVVERGILL